MRFPARFTSCACVALAMSFFLLGSCRVEHDDQDTSSETSPATAQVRIGEIDWFVDYETARAHARDVDKPLWVHFGEHPG